MGRVVCFEQILCQIIQVMGFVNVRAKVVPVLQMCDTALRAAFGSGNQATEANTVECRHNYIDELRKFPIDLLLTNLPGINLQDFRSSGRLRSQ